MMLSFAHRVGIFLLISLLLNLALYLSPTDNCESTADTFSRVVFDDSQQQPLAGSDSSIQNDTTQLFEASLPPSVYPIQRINCRNVGNKIKSIKHGWELNELRRNLTLTDPECMQQHFEDFAKAFLPRLYMKQYNLHIPKTGGTSLCRLVRENKIKAPPKLCRHRAYCPYWCNFCATRKKVSCDALSKLPFSFIGNERWLDFGQEYEFCDGFAHSITIREPVARAISNVNMWFGTCNGKRNYTGFQRAERLQIVQSNYMTWSLTSGTSIYPEGFQPTLSQVALAKRMLTRFDYIIDVQDMNVDCFSDIVQYMGFYNTSIDHYRVAAANYSLAYNFDNYQMMNSLDVQVYKFAQSLMTMDCAFFRQIKQTMAIPPVPTPPPTPQATKKVLGPKKKLPKRLEDAQATGPHRIKRPIRKKRPGTSPRTPLFQPNTGRIPNNKLALAREQLANKLAAGPTKAKNKFGRRRSP